MIAVERAPVTRADELAQRTARTNEHRVMVAAHPVAWRACRVATRLDPDLCYVPGFGYLVSGAEMLRELSLDLTRFRKDGSASVGTIITQIFGPNALANMEGPAHANLRRELQPTFAPGASEAAVARAVAPLLESLAQRLRDGEVVDLACFSKVAAATALAGAIGSTSAAALGEQRALELHGAASRLAGLLSLRLRPLSPSALAKARSLMDELLRFTAGNENTSEGDTVTGVLRSAGMDSGQTQGATAMLMVAGMETTSVALARVTALLSDTASWSRLDREALTSTAVLDEALRYVSPLPMVTRTVAEDCEVRGHRFRRGRTLVGFIYSAVRDARVIERGDEFDPRRAIPASLRQLWFGAGAHFCIGMPLARALLVRTVGTLAEVGGVEVVARQPAARVLLPTYARLLVRRRRPSTAENGR